MPALDGCARSAHFGVMKKWLPNKQGSSLLGYAEALLLVAVSTLVGLLISPRWGNSAVDLLYLPAVLTVAVTAGLAPAILSAIASALAYNFFFTAPYHTLRVHSPADV